MLLRTNPISLSTNFSIHPRNKNFFFLGLKKRFFSQFLSLGSLSPENSQKYLYAVNIRPDTGALQSLPDLTTPCPFSTPSTPQASIPPPPPMIAGGFNRWGLSDPENPTGAKNNSNKRSADFDFSSSSRKKNSNQQKPKFKLNECWFCLSNSKTERHLVTSVAHSWYLALAKGGLVPEHSLLLPVEHLSNLTGLVPVTDQVHAAILEELSVYKQKLRALYQNKCVFFEIVNPPRNLGGKDMQNSMHMHIHCVPLVNREGKEIVDPFKEYESLIEKLLSEAPKAIRTEFEKFPLKIPNSNNNNHEQKKLAAADEILYQQLARNLGYGYIYFDFPGKFLFAMLTNNIPLQWPRTMVAQWMFGADKAESKIDWKKCVQTTEEENLTVSEFKKRFKPLEFQL